MKDIEALIPIIGWSLLGVIVATWAYFGLVAK